MFSKKWIVALGVVLTGGVVAASTDAVSYGLGFVAPQVSGRTNVANPATGEIVYDQTDKNFFGRDDAGGWINFGLAAESGNPTGAVLAYVGTSVPTGYELCDGREVSREGKYANLFAAIGTAFGAGDGLTTFNLPDLRGQFLRGVDGTANVDADKNTRMALKAGGAAGNNIGSFQGHAFQTHTHIQNPHSHSITGANPAGGNNMTGRGTSGNGQGTSNDASNTTATNQNAGATGTFAQASTNETRPVNVYVNFIIKL